MSTVYGVWQESDVVSIALFFCCTIPITLLENQNALNLGSGQSPVSRRLLPQVSCKPFRFRIVRHLVYRLSWGVGKKPFCQLPVGQFIW